MASGAMAEVLGTILEGLPNPVFVKDERHRWVLLNDSFCRLMGHPREALLGKSDHDFFPQREAEVFWSKDDAVFASGGVNENEEHFTDAAGREHIILTRKTLHTAADGRCYLVGVITDITERKQMEEDLRHSRDELERRVSERTAELKWLNQQLQVADQRKNDFIGVLSHELRNPLGAIHRSLELDRAPAGSEQRARRWRSSPARRAALAAGRRPPRRDAGDAREDQPDAGADRSARGGPRTRWRITPRPSSAAGVRARGAPRRPRSWSRRSRALAQIVGNLLHNASKFTPNGGSDAVILGARKRRSGCG